MEQFHYKQAFVTEAGATLPELTIAYRTYGKLNESRTNVVWICHALTASATAADWWPGIVGQGCVISPEKHFIVCANILGSCYGSTGPLSQNPQTGVPYYHSFPLLTIRDLTRAHRLLCDYLEISTIALLVGGSMGGYQALEWSVTQPARIQRLFLIATSAQESPWGVAIHTAQRLAIEADCTWPTTSDTAGSKGLKAARAIGMLTYRNYHTFAQTQSDTDNQKIEGFRASSYIEHQGNKLVKRFNAFSYWGLTKTMDTHNLSRGRGQNVEAVLQTIRQPTLIISISSDLLCPVKEGERLAEHIPNNRFVIIDSAYGHDGFLTEHIQIGNALQQWWQ